MQEIDKSRRKDMKKVIIICLILMVGLMLIPTTTVYANDGDVLEESSWAEEFENNWMPKIENAIVVFVGAVLGLLSLSYPILRLVRLIKDTIEKLKEAKGDTERQAEIIIEQESKFREINEELKLTKERLETAIESNAVLRKNYAEIKEMLKLGFGNIKELVVNGYAQQIAEIGEEDNEQ